MSKSLIAPEEMPAFHQRVQELKRMSATTTNDGELSRFEENPYFVEFHRQAEKLRRKEPQTYTSDFDAQAEISRRYPELHDAAWSRTWEEAFLNAVAYETKWQGMSLDQAYRQVATFMPQGAKAVHLSQLRRW